MKIEDLISKGYFSEELPPPFVSSDYGGKIEDVQKLILSLNNAELKKLTISDFVRFSIPKVGVHRRHNGIANPFHQLKLSEVIVKNWPSINTHYKKSKISASIPFINTVDKRAITQFALYEDFKEKCIETSFDTFFELRTDISKYFPTIYSHSIPWAIHTKTVAKIHRKPSTHYGNAIDQCVRNCQNGQTIGLPIGSDTSRIIAEIIGCYIDEQFINQMAKEKIFVKGHRFVDDCHFFFYSQADAEKGLKHFQKILDDLSLNINEEKTVINNAPFFFQNNWNHKLNSFKIRKVGQYQRLDLRNFFNLVINLAKQYPRDSVIKYGMKKFRKLTIDKNNWELYESLSYAFAVAEGSVLPDLLIILMQNKSLVNHEKLSSTIKSLLNQHIYKGNNFEVAWTLWIAKSFKVKIPLKIAQLILESRDIVSIIILLDLRANKLVSSKVNTTSIELEFNKDGLINNYWLLVYEGCHKKWITSTALSTVKFFEDISNLGITFYDPTQQVRFGNPNVFLPNTKRNTKKKTKLDEESTNNYVG